MSNNGIIKRANPQTKVNLGSGQITSPNCTDYEYTSTEISYEFSKPYQELVTEFTPGNNIYTMKFEQVPYSSFDIYEVTTITTWMANSCSPDEKRNIVSTSSKKLFKKVTEKGKLTDSGGMPSSVVRRPSYAEILSANGITNQGINTIMNGIPPVHIPDHIATIMAYGILGTGWITHYGIKPDSLSSRKETKADSAETPEGSQNVQASEVESEPSYDSSKPDVNSPDLRLSFYGYDRSDDEGIHLNEGPGFNYRDREVREVSIGSTITREELSSAVITHNGHIPDNWDTALVVGASFQPLSDVPKDCETYSVTYGYWIMHLKPLWK